MTISRVMESIQYVIIGEWPSLKNFNQKENTMEYMTNQMMQRFMSNMTNTLSSVQLARADIEGDIEEYKNNGNKFLQYLYLERQMFKKTYVKYAAIQEHMKRGFIGHRTLQKMEKIVTHWLVNLQQESQFAYEDYLENRYDTFYRNRTKQAKKKLAKLVELQQAIRKQKRVTRN